MTFILENPGIGELFLRSRSLSPATKRFHFSNRRTLKNAEYEGQKSNGNIVDVL